MAFSDLLSRQTTFMCPRGVEIPKSVMIDKHFVPCYVTSTYKSIKGGADAFRNSYRWR